MKKLMLFTSLLLSFYSCSGQNEAKLENDKTNQIMSQNLEKATFGGGCFWCVEAVFEQLNGVEKVVSGYAGGHTKNPTYEQVSSGTTGHAEVIQVEFNPQVITYDELLDVFWTVHDPTQLNRQGNDIGEQYRSIILYENEQQKQAAKQSIVHHEGAKMYQGKFKTKVEPLKEFYPAEKYHQEYYQNNADKNPYCSLVIKPKIDKFYEKFYDKLKPEFK